MELREILYQKAKQYPEELIPGQLQDIPRAEFHIQLITRSARPKRVSDLNCLDMGSGIGLFPIACAAYGFNRMVIVDDFDDAINHRLGPSVLQIHQTHGVEVFSRDLIAQGIADLPGSFDVITSFDSMEHWHHSPKRLFHQALSKLKPGGVFILGVPNCVNLRKRLTVPLGLGRWSAMQDWFEPPKFRGHVREPSYEDLLYIARDMNLTNVRVIGRNWMGRVSYNRWIRVASIIFDFALRMRPQFCSDLYLVGYKIN